jgi:hypothetical protein
VNPGKPFRDGIISITVCPIVVPIGVPFDDAARTPRGGLFHRYPHGIRGVAGFAYGISQLPWPTFLALNFVAAGLWSCAIVSAGYAFGQVSEKVMSDASSGSFRQAVMKVH